MFDNFIWQEILTHYDKPGPKKGIPTSAAACLQCWAIQISTYNYDIEFCAIVKHANADVLSHFPMEMISSEGCLDAKLFSNS